MSETAQMLGDTTTRILERHVAADRSSVVVADVLSVVRESGLDQVLVAPEFGGAGCSLAEASQIALAWGRFAAPLPIVDLLVGNCVGGRRRRMHRFILQRVAGERVNRNAVACRWHDRGSILAACERVCVVASGKDG